MGRGLAWGVLAALLFSSIAGAVVLSSVSPTSGPMKLWEAYARGYVTVTQVNITYDRGGFTVTLPVGYRVSVSASAPTSVAIDEPSMLMSPSPAQFGVDPSVPTTQDGAITVATIPAGASVTYSYAEEWLQGFLPAPPWWCTEDSQFTHGDVGIVLGGEILPGAIQGIIASPYYDSDSSNTQVDVWNYLRQHPTIVVGKTPFWKEIPQTAGQVISVAVTATNIAVKDANDAFTGDVDAHGANVTDVIPSGWSVVPGSYSIQPTNSWDNPDGSKTVSWIVDIPAADVTGKSDLSTPTPYHGVKFRYQLESPHLAPGRVDLARAEVDTDGNHEADAHSEIPVLDVFRVNNAPLAALGGPVLGVEGSPITFNASTSSDPDGDALQYRWDFESDGVWDTTFSADPVSPAMTFGDERSGTVTVGVSDGEFESIATASFQILNAAPVIDSVTIVPGAEGSPTTITVAFSDPGWLDTHTVFLDWGTGEMETFAATTSHDPPAGTGTFTITHTFGDDYTYAAKLVIVDDDGGSVLQDLSLPVANVAPTVTSTDIQMFVDAQVCLRVAGTSWNSVRLDLYSDAALAGSVTVTRTPGSPNDQARCILVEADLLATHTYRAVVTFEPKPGAKSGSNPVWLLIQPMRDPLTPGHAVVSLHHVFHVKDPTTYVWNATLTNLGSTLICGCKGGDHDDHGHDHEDHGHDGCRGDDDSCGDHGEDVSGSHDSKDDGQHGCGTRDSGSADLGACGTVGQGGDSGCKDSRSGDHSKDGCAEQYAHDDGCGDSGHAFGGSEEHDDHAKGCGVQVHIRVTATDPGTDDLMFTWTFSDGSVVSRTYFNDAMNPDPRPSSLGLRPMVVTDSVVHDLSNPCGKTVTLTLADDDGGVTTLVLTIRP